MRILVRDLRAGGERVTVAGWVNARRDHGGLIFVDLRDHTGVVQLVVGERSGEEGAAGGLGGDVADGGVFELAESLRDEFVIEATGVVRERAEGLKNPNIASGDIEIVVEGLRLLNRSEALPVGTRDDVALAGEELRLKYRFLDLRRPSMQKILAARARYYKFLRDYMESEDFIEVTTPILANSSPEGARDFLVPSRIHAGKFYALPQAPQQFKQLLMVGGVPRYYQIAACFRDEDPRADRLYGDFYQLDLEMSFVEDGEVVRRTMEPLMVRLVTEFAGKKLVTDPKNIPRIAYGEAMERFGTDKPDLRYGMELVELTEDLKGVEFAVFAKAECVKAILVKGGAGLTRSQIDGFTDEAKRLGAGGLAYIKFGTNVLEKENFLSGGEPVYGDGQAADQLVAFSPIAKYLVKELPTIVERMGVEDGDAVFFGADARGVVNKVLGELRIAFADHFGLKKADEVALCWIVDFPFYEWSDGGNKLDFGHNPFSMPKGGLMALDAEDKLAILADQYDMVMNGYEICSGAVRNHDPEIMYKAFGVLGYDAEYVEGRFGGMLSAFKFGAPPHAGCAFGIDRIFMVLNDTENIRDIVAFPKNGSGVDLMMGSPSFVDGKQIEELGWGKSR